MAWKLCKQHRLPMHASMRDTETAKMRLAAFARSLRDTRRIGLALAAFRLRDA